MRIRSGAVLALSLALPLAPASAVATAAGASATPAAAPPSTPAAAPAVLPEEFRLAVAAASFSPASMSASLTNANRSPYLGRHLSGLVIDRATGNTVWSAASGTTRMPASTNKLLTAYTVLHTMDASTTISTLALRSDANPGNVYLRGGGDPTLTPERLRQLALSTGAQLKAQGRNSVRLYLDDTVFPRPSLATGWKSSYISAGETQWVRGLTLNGYRGADGTVAAGKVFRTYLAKAGITVTDFGRGTAPAQRTQLASTESASVGAIIGTMLRVSDNDRAEYLLRLAALRSGAYPTWAAAVAHERAVLADTGISTAGLRVYDGSGLSRSDRMPVRTLTQVVAGLYGDGEDRDVVFASGAIPRAGQTGTLASRFHIPATRCAAGRVLAKTGTLGDAVALAGLARGVDGRDRIFAFLENGITDTTAARNAVDALAAVTVGCRR